MKKKKQLSKSNCSGPLILFAVICLYAVNASGECVKGDCENGQGMFIPQNDAECIKGDCINGQGTYTESYTGYNIESVARKKISYKGKITYTGQFKDGKADGQGILTTTTITITNLPDVPDVPDVPDLTSEMKYTGEFRNGKAEGEGTFVLALTPNALLKTEYTGEFKNGKSDGKGTLLHPGYLKYVGEFKNGNAHGQGKMSFLFDSSNSQLMLYAHCSKRDYIGNFENGFYKGHVSSACPLMKQKIFGFDVLSVPLKSTQDLVDLNGKWKSGTWSGPPHTIEIRQTGEDAIATSIRPGVNIGSVFWKWNVKTGQGKGQLFEHRVPDGPYDGPTHWESCTAQINDANTITIRLGGTNIPYTRISSGVNPYKLEQSVEYGWGDKPEDFGLRDEEGLEILGPHTFALDRNGNMHVIDTINGHVKTFGTDKTFQRNIDFPGWGSDIAIGDSGELLTLERDNITLSSSSGQSRHELSRKIPDIEGYGQGMYFDDAGNLYDCKFQQCYQIGKEIDGKLKILDPEAQAANVIPGYPIKGGKYVRTLWKNNHEAVIEIMDEDWAIIREIPMKSDDVFGAVVFLRQDEAGFLYLEVERITEDNYVHLEIWKYDETGECVSVTELPNEYYSTVYKKAQIDPKGGIHQVVTTLEGVKILKWRPE